MIIAAGTLVNRDVPNDSFVAGVPCRVVGSFETFVNKRTRKKINEFSVINQKIPDEMAEWYWKEFERERNE